MTACCTCLWLLKHDWCWNTVTETECVLSGSGKRCTVSAEEEVFGVCVLMKHRSKIGEEYCCCFHRTKNWNESLFLVNLDLQTTLSSVIWSFLILAVTAGMGCVKTLVTLNAGEGGSRRWMTAYQRRHWMILQGLSRFIQKDARKASSKLIAGSLKCSLEIGQRMFSSWCKEVPVPNPPFVSPTCSQMTSLGSFQSDSAGWFGFLHKMNEW